ncbi:Ionotropic receptor 353 [Blattella germanica]|nr:Ionotropic receptor 353 [Blattella germanica]
MNMKDIWMVVCFLSGCEALLRPPVLWSSEEYLADCITNISKTYFDKDKPLFIQTPSSYLHTGHRYFKIGQKLIQILHNENYFSKIIFDVSTARHVNATETTQKPGSYVIVIPRVETQEEYNFVDLMKTSIGQVAYNPKGKAIIAAIQSTSRSPLNSLNFFVNFFETGFTEIIILEPQVSFQHLNIFGWTINDQEDICTQKIHKLKYIDSWNNQEKRYLKNKNLFPMREKLNLNGCTLKVTVPAAPPYVYSCPQGICGFMKDFFRIMKEVIHFKFKVVSEYSKYDVIFPHIYEQTLINYECLASYPVFNLDFGWLVPSGLQIPQWQTLFYTFNPILWSLVILTFVCGSCTMWLLQISSKDYTKTSKNNKEVLFTALLTHLEVGVGERYKGVVAVVFFSLWLYYCLIINTAYQSQFFELLVHPRELPSVNSISELKESNLIKERYFQLSSAYYIHVAKYPRCVGNIKCYDKLAKYRTHAILTDTMNALFVARHSKNNRGKLKLKLLPGIEGTMLMSMRMQTFSLSCIFIDEVNLLLHRLLNAGIMDMWFKRLLWLRALVFDKDIKSIYVFKFSLSDLQSAFYLLYFGLILAICMYITEIVIFSTRYMFFLMVIRRSLNVFNYF